MQFWCLISDNLLTRQANLHCDINRPHTAEPPSRANLASSDFDFPCVLCNLIIFHFNFVLQRLEFGSRTTRPERVYSPLGLRCLYIRRQSKCMEENKKCAFASRNAALLMSFHSSFNIYTVPFRRRREMQFSNAIDALSWLNWVNSGFRAATRFVYAHEDDERNSFDALSLFVGFCW